eukprot:GILJ01010031.1.p1 GENE.GILJ01010031.1~~GILJ01010031.1.p1  ORF type:complete len:543 (-),score=104.09 GILJ01010031.1:117-1700(-)
MAMAVSQGSKITNFFESTRAERSVSSEQLAEKERQLQAHKQELEKVRLSLTQKEEQLKQYETELQSLQQKLQLVTAINMDEQKERERREQLVATSLMALLRELYAKEREEVRAKVTRDTTQLGKILPARNGVLIGEAWEDGEAFKDLQRQQQQIAKERDEIDKRRKQLWKPKRGTSKEDVTSADDEYIAEQREIFSLRMTILARDEQKLNEALEKLEVDKNLHIRELKRIRDEDRSRFNNFPVLNQRYLLLNMLGKGGFSEVYKAYDLVEHRDVACKIHQLNSSWNDDKKSNYIKHSLREYEIHKQLKHPRVVQLFDMFEIDINSFCTVLEYSNGQDLDVYLKKHKILPEKEARMLVSQIFSGLKYLNDQKQKIIHYDLKPGNILFFKGEAKITDFGLSKIMDEAADGMELTSQGAGTYWYLPPECFETGRQPPMISSKVDVWSAGVIFYQMLYGQRPFGHNMSQEKILSERTITNATSVQFPPKPVVSAECKDFIRKCLSHRQELRFDVHGAYNDPYLRRSNPGKL